MMMRNPIIPGYDPDPSVVRVGEDVYVCNSSFNMYPGLPIYRSRDLCNWELKGYAFNRPSQLPLTCDRLTGGLFAPTIRYHDGLFYAIVVNMSIGQTCIVTAKEVDGEWSEPHLLPSMFDPDIFWDDDGKCYITYAAHGENFRNTIETVELDTEKWELAGEPKYLWTSALVDAHAPEGPHMYKISGWYYLLIAEGGTEHNHAVTIARSRNIFGPYEGNPANPILTHRHLTSSYPICNVGHADMVEMPDGKWYMVFLGSRIYGGYHKIMGRETFMAPVIWEDGWPKVSPETGRCEWEYPVEYPEYPVSLKSGRDDFDGEKLDLEWNFIGTPVNDVYRLEGGRLYLKCVAEAIRPTEIKAGVGGPTHEKKEIQPRTKAFISRRQRDIDFEALCEVEFCPEKGETAGIAIVQEAYNDLRVEIANEDGRKVVRAVKYSSVPVTPGFNPERKVEETVLGKADAPCGKIVIGMEAKGVMFDLFAEMDGKRVVLAEGVDGGFMGSETSGGCVGSMVGMFASGNGADSANEAAFDSFTYNGK